MKVPIINFESITIAEAIKMQIELSSKIQEAPDENINNFRYIGGIDCAPSKDKKEYRSAVVIWDLEKKEIIECKFGSSPIGFPYIPGFLSFREIPAIIAALNNIQHIPNIFIVDGQGIAHPRGLGIAAHLGVIIDHPTFGCAKSLLYGKYQEPNKEKGSINPLLAKGKQIGNVLRTKYGVKPVIISIGNKINLELATQLTFLATGKYRLPEPTRLADKLLRTSLEEV